MSLDNFFKKPPKSAQRKKGSKRTAKTALASQDGEAEHELTNDEDEQESCTELEMSDADCTRDDMVVDRMTRNIEKLLDTKLATVLKPVTEMSEKLDKLVNRVGTAEQRVSDLEDIVAANSSRLDSVKSDLQKTMEKLESYENQSRRLNVKIMGLKEKSEGRNPIVFFERWIPEVLNMDMHKPFTIERAHRLGPEPDSSGGQRPRAVLVRLRDYTDRQRILQAARNKGKVSFGGREVSFYQDFSADVVKRRSESAGARRKLRQAGVKYAFLYPATIKIFPQEGRPISLPTLKEINNYVETLPGTE